jgi:hypothetical protein
MRVADVYSHIGGRFLQEDVYWVENFLGGGFVAAICDGFSKGNKEESCSGAYVARKLIEALKDQLSGHEPATVSYFERLDRHLDRKLEHCIGGTTLSLVYRQSGNPDWIFMLRGDSVIFSHHKSRKGNDVVDIYPRQHLHGRHDGLWSSYGDTLVNPRRTAEVVHPHTDTDMIFLASDGFYPVMKSVFGARDFVIARQSNKYCQMLRENNKLSALAAEAKKNGSTDNLTAIVIR